MPETLSPGEAFSINLILETSRTDVFAVSASVYYDYGKFQFTGFQEKENIFAVRVDQAVYGELDLYLASNQPISGAGKELIELQFATSRTAEMTNGFVSVDKAIAGTAPEGLQIPAAGDVHGIFISERILPGDMNQDGMVNIGDLSLVMSYFGITSADPVWDSVEKYDITGSSGAPDGMIDILDITYVARIILAGQK